MFQPAGGMGRIGEAFARQIPNAIRYRAKVTGIHQDERGVTITFEDRGGGAVQPARADWCVCALPLTILGQLPVNVSAAMKAAIDAVPYASVVKTGLQFKRRFWEEDEHIFGGISYTDLPIRQIAYPSAGMNAGGKGVLLGGYTWEGPNAYELRDVAGRAHPGRARLRRANPSAISVRVRDGRLGRLASRAVHARVRGRMERRGAPRPL
jgi:monoamine oxidase